MKYKNVNFFLSRCEKGKLQKSVEISPELEKGLSNFSQKYIALRETLRMFKGTKTGPRKGKWNMPLRLGGDGLWPIR